MKQWEKESNRPDISLFSHTSHTQRNTHTHTHTHTYKCIHTHTHAHTQDVHSINSCRQCGRNGRCTETERSTQWSYLLILSLSFFLPLSPTASCDTHTHTHAHTRAHIRTHIMNLNPRRGSASAALFLAPSHHCSAVVVVMQRRPLVPSPSPTCPRPLALALPMKPAHAQPSSSEAFFSLRHPPVPLRTSIGQQLYPSRTPHHHYKAFEAPRRLTIIAL